MGSQGLKRVPEGEDEDEPALGLELGKGLEGGAVHRRGSHDLRDEFLGILEVPLDDLDRAARVDDEAGIRFREGEDHGIALVELDAGYREEGIGGFLAARPRLAQEVVEDRKVEVGIMLEEEEAGALRALAASRSSRRRSKCLISEPGSRFSDTTRSMKGRRDRLPGW